MRSRSAPPRPRHLRLGAAAEDASRRHLEARGFTLVTANYRSRYGEIDLVMQHGNLLVFVEVRLRRHPGFGGAAASVTRAKQQKIIASAQSFLQDHPQFSHCNCRFDVLAVEADAGCWKIEWLPGAFTT